MQVLFEKKYLLILRCFFVVCWYSILIGHSLFMDPRVASLQDLPKDDREGVSPKDDREGVCSPKDDTLSFVIPDLIQNPV